MGGRVGRWREAAAWQRVPDICRSCCCQASCCKCCWLCCLAKVVLPAQQPLAAAQLLPPFAISAHNHQVKETTHDACFLHNEQFFAAAQKRYTYIYDKRGLEVHCLEVRAAAALWHPVWSACWTVAVHPSAWLWPCAMAVLLGCGSCARWPILTQCRASLPCRPSSQAPVRSPACKQDTTEATRLEFLPHHFLLGSIGSTGVLRYQDTSTGRIVATHRTKQVGSRVGRWWYGLFGSRWAHVRQVQMAGHRPYLCA